MPNPRGRLSRIPAVTGCIIWSAAVSFAAAAEPLTLPLDQRPEWVAREGIVMAGSWEPLLFRVRRDGAAGYTPSPEQEAAYTREHSPEMIDRLKALGVNFAMIHCYKGAGLEAERQSMEDAARFAKLCHEAGLRVGVYNYSGAFLWEPLFRELPQARDWVLLDEEGRPRTYGKAAYRYYWDRNHPDAQAFYRTVIEFAVNRIQADLIHFDNYEYGPGSDSNSVRRFQQYLARTFSGDQLVALKPIDAEVVRSIMTGAEGGLLRFAWLDFHAQSLADSYFDMGRFARSLRKDILLECNPQGPGERMSSRIDHGRLLQGGEAYWDEGPAPGLREDKLHTRIRTYKIARRMNNLAFLYTTTPLEMAEAMAFNLDCLGCICWFEYGDIVQRPGSSEPVAGDVANFVRFFRERRDLLRDAKIVADIAVLRSYPSQVFAGSEYAAMTAQVEQSLIEQPTCFQIIYDHQLSELTQYKILVLAGCIALSDAQIERVAKFVENGGRLAIVGPLATHDEWMRRRNAPALDSLPQDRVIRCEDPGEVLPALRRTWPEDLTLAVEAPFGVCCEVTEQPGRRLVHVVNYRQREPATDVYVQVLVPEPVTQVVLASPQHALEITVPFEQIDGVVRFAMPQVDVYEIALLSVEQRRGIAAGK